MSHNQLEEAIYDAARHGALRRQIKLILARYYLARTYTSLIGRINVGIA